MTDRQPTTDSTEILNRIDRFSYDADWTIEELRDSLKAEGIDPDLALETIKSKLAPIYKFKEKPLDKEESVINGDQPSVAISSGILEAIKQLNLSKGRILAITGLSETLLIKIDRRLVSLEKYTKIASGIAGFLQTTKEAIVDYSNGNTLYPAEVNFKADKLPELPPKQSFTEAIKTDALLTDDEKNHLLSLRDED